MTVSLSRARWLQTRSTWLQHVLGRPVRQPRLASTSRSIAQSRQSLPRKTPDPAIDLQARYAHPLGDLLLRQPLGAQQDDLRAPTVAHRRRARANPAPQRRSLFRSQLDLLTSHDPPPTGRPRAPRSTILVTLFSKRHTRSETVGVGTLV